MATTTTVLAVIATAVTRGADAALAEAIEYDLIPASAHIDSDAWADALADAEEA